MNSFLDACRNWVRAVMEVVAKLLNTASGGKISPSMITITALFAHIPIAWLIATQQNLLAGGLLVIFGLFDALDGALARLQKSASDRGLLLDATTDRFKEVLLYCGAAYGLVASGHPYAAAWAVAACGASLSVSYVKAKGETVVAGKYTAQEVNRMFQDGLLRYEIRMFMLVVGLVADKLMGAVIIIAVLSAFTAIDRLIRISRKLS